MSDDARQEIGYVDHLGNPTRCRKCGADGKLLHLDPDHVNNPVRCLCGPCQSKASRNIVGWPVPKTDDDQPPRRKR